MSRRTWLMLMVVTGVVFGLGAVKVLQIQAAIAQASSFQPPPEAVTTIVARAEQWPTTLAAIGTVGAVQGVTRERRPAGRRRSRSRFDSGRPVREGDVLVRLDTRQEQAQLAAAEAQRELARLNLERMRGLVAQGIVAAGRVRPRQRGAQAGRGARRRDPRDDRAQDDPRAVLGRARHPPGQPRAVPDAGDPIVPLQSLDPIYVNFARAAAAARRGARRARGARERRRDRPAASSRAASPRSTRSWTRRRATCRCRRRSPTRKARCGPACSCRRASSRGQGRSARGAAGLGDQLRALRRLGLRRRASSTGANGGGRQGACASSS